LATLPQPISTHGSANRAKLQTALTFPVISLISEKLPCLAAQGIPT
jgi:hypothetical protein